MTKRRRTLPKKRKKGEPIPWQEIEDRYVQGDESHRQLAQVYSLKSKQVGHYASSNHWTAKRFAFRSQVRKATSEKVFDEKVAMGVETLMRGMRDRLDHLARLTELREAETKERVMKARDENDREEFYRIESPWSMADHKAHREAYDKTEEGLLRAIGAEGVKLETGRDLPMAYLTKRSRFRVGGENDDAGDQHGGDAEEVPAG